MPRTSLPDGHFHVSARGVDRATPLFGDAEDRIAFLHLLRVTTNRYEWSCHALCVMTTHYHLVVECTQHELSAGLRWLNGVYAMHFNRRHRRFGHVFADRFSARAIDDDAYLRDVCAYVVLNPVKAGLCERSEDWPWSYSRYGLESA